MTRMRFASNRSFIHVEVILGVLTATFGYAGIDRGSLVNMLMEWNGTVLLSIVLMLCGLTMAVSAVADRIAAVCLARSCRCFASVRAYSSLLAGVIWLAISAGPFQSALVDVVSGMKVMPLLAFPYGVVAYVVNLRVFVALSSQPTSGLMPDRRRG